MVVALTMAKCRWGIPVLPSIVLYVSSPSHLRTLSTSSVTRESAMPGQVFSARRMAFCSASRASGFLLPDFNCEEENSLPSVQYSADLQYWQKRVSDLLCKDVLWVIRYYFICQRGTECSVVRCLRLQISIYWDNYKISTHVEVWINRLMRANILAN